VCVCDPGRRKESAGANCSARGGELKCLRPGKLAQAQPLLARPVDPPVCSTSVCERAARSLAGRTDGVGFWAACSSQRPAGGRIELTGHRVQVHRSLVGLRERVVRPARKLGRSLASDGARRHSLRSRPARDWPSSVGLCAARCSLLVASPLTPLSASPSALASQAKPKRNSKLHCKSNTPPPQQLTNQSIPPVVAQTAAAAAAANTKPGAPARATGAQATSETRLP